MSSERPTNGLHKRTADPVGGQGKLIALLRREAELKEEELEWYDARAEADRILQVLKDPDVDPATKQQIKDRFAKLHRDWIDAYEGERDPAPRARGRTDAPVGILEQFKQSFTITGDLDDFVANDVVQNWLDSTNQTKSLRELKSELRTHCQNQNPPIVIDTGARLAIGLGDRTNGIKGIKKIEVVVEPATIPAETERITGEEANLTSKIRELNDTAERLLETGAVTVKGTKQRSEAQAVFQFVVPAAQSQLNHCIRFLKKGDDLPTAVELKSYYEGKIDALDYLQDAQRDQMKRCVRAASPDLAPVTIVKKCAELNLELCGGCQNVADIIARRASKKVTTDELAKPENLCVNRRESQEALEAGVVLRRVHEAIADELKTYEKSVLQGMVDRGASLEDCLRPRARFAVQHEHEVRAKASAGHDLGPANRAWLKAARKMNWTGRKHTAQGNNDPHTRRVRVLTDRMRSTVRIWDL